MKKLIGVSVILIFAVVLLTGCSGGNLTTTIIEHDMTGIEEISGRIVITIESDGDWIRTWEEITHYDLEEYMWAYGYANEEEIREWFRRTRAR